MEYSHRFGSQFPTELIPIGTKQDVDEATIELVNQCNQFIENNDMASAYALYMASKNVLEPCIANSAYFNRLEEEIYNASACAFNGQTIIVSDTEPSSQTTWSSWLKEW